MFLVDHTFTLSARIMLFLKLATRTAKHAPIQWRPFILTAIYLLLLWLSSTLKQEILLLFGGVCMGWIQQISTFSFNLVQRLLLIILD